MYKGSIDLYTKKLMLRRESNSYKKYKGLINSPGGKEIIVIQT